VYEELTMSRKEKGTPSMAAKPVIAEGRKRTVLAAGGKKD